MSTDNPPKPVESLIAAEPIPEPPTDHEEPENKRSQTPQSGWSSPTVLALIAATVGLLGNLAVAAYNGSTSRQIERDHLRSSLILQAIGTGGPDTACRNLNFFVSLGFVEDPKGTIHKCGDNPSSSPYLPATGQIDKMARLMSKHFHDTNFRQVEIPGVDKSKVSIRYYLSDNCILIMSFAEGKPTTQHWVGCDE